VNQPDQFTLPLAKTEVTPIIATKAYHRMHPMNAMLRKRFAMADGLFMCFQKA
jgi:hypothetical protein